MKNIQIIALLVSCSIISTITILLFDGTGDAGDSIHHYLYAKYAPDHPELFFDHWAKPVYVLLASPFAQFGFAGIKIFNAITSLFTVYFTFKTAQLLNLKNAIVSSIILYASPLYFVLTFSGLTEPLFALFTILGIFLLLKDKKLLSCLIISFLPFVRSEGLIIIGIFIFYFLLKKQWKYIPALFIGHLVYSFAGYFVYRDILWIFNKIPYARLGSPYGKGELFHFIEKLYYIIGLPIYILFWLGLINLIWKSIKQRINLELHVIVLLGFLSFLIAHTLFWYLGIFNSMGLKRVLIGVAPLISIISLIGFNFITEEVFKNGKVPKLISQGLITSYIIIFPFTNNPAGIDWDRDLSLSIDQKTAIQIADYVTELGDSNQRYVFAHTYLSEALHIDHFDYSKRMELTKDYKNQINSGDIIIWDNWFAVVEFGVKKELLDNDDELIKLNNFKAVDKGREILYSVYRRR